MENCPICFEKLGSLNITVTECGHLFHFKCILKNIKLNPNNGFKCAICRRNFLPVTIPLKTYFSTSNYSSVQHNSFTYRPNVNRANISRTNANVYTQSQAYLSNLIEQRRRNSIENQQRQANIIRLNINRTIRTPVLSDNQRKRNEIKKLSFSELKNRMKQYGISTRGYIRENLEKRLFDSLNLHGE